MTPTALITIVQGRQEHLNRQALSISRGSRLPDWWIVVAMDDPDLTLPDASVLHIDADPDGLPLAAARNAGAAHAISLGAEVLVFLDVDCLAGEGLIEGYARAVPDAVDVVWSGPVTYLPPPPGDGYDLTRLESYDAPHRGRPAPPPGTRLLNPDPDLFWSLSFALHARTWEDVGGFCEEYVGYGGEDTDFGRLVHHRGFRHGWLGDARAYHQHHPVESPPRRHLRAIVRNSTIFHTRWGQWPMTTWLTAFAELGLIEFRDGMWRLQEAQDARVAGVHPSSPSTTPRTSRRTL